MALIPRPLLPILGEGELECEHNQSLRNLGEGRLEAGDS